MGHYYTYNLDCVLKIEESNPDLQKLEALICDASISDLPDASLSAMGYRLNPLSGYNGSYGKYTVSFALVERDLYHLTVTSASQKNQYGDLEKFFDFLSPLVVAEENQILGNGDWERSFFHDYVYQNGEITEVRTHSTLDNESGEW
jgi:hypothetical protein